MVQLSHPYRTTGKTIGLLAKWCLCFYYAVCRCSMSGSNCCFLTSIQVSQETGSRLHWSRAVRGKQLKSNCSSKEHFLCFLDTEHLPGFSAGWGQRIVRWSIAQYLSLLLLKCALWIFRAHTKCSRCSCVCSHTCCLTKTVLYVFKAEYPFYETERGTISVLWKGL